MQACRARVGTPSRVAWRGEVCLAGHAARRCLRCMCLHVSCGRACHLPPPPPQVPGAAGARALPWSWSAADGGRLCGCATRHALWPGRTVARLDAAAQAHAVAGRGRDRAAAARAGQGQGGMRAPGASSILRRPCCAGLRCPCRIIMLPARVVGAAHLPLLFPVRSVGHGVGVTGLSGAACWTSVLWLPHAGGCR